MDFEREPLVQSLRKIEANKFQPENGRKAAEYLPAMLQFLGDPDPELRDELIYSTLANWVTNEGFLTPTDLVWLLVQSLDKDHLFYKIGHHGETSIFTRSFSVLTIALLLYQHRKQAFLSQNEVSNTKAALLAYLAQEKDWRGYTADYGWAHAAAHSADALDELVQCHEVDATGQKEVLAALIPVLWNGGALFCDEEDERISALVCSIIQTGKLAAHEIIEWSHQLLACLEQPRSHAQFCARVNSKNLMRCLYFRFQSREDTTSVLLASEFLTIAQKLNKYL
ncbi:MAG: DUF2785 domain-containing protein [Anaerolineaceae bacterium]|nr:DUF2785 domain-containing protein [Anaerolineaceae bacterium]